MAHDLMLALEHGGRPPARFAAEALATLQAVLEHRHVHWDVGPALVAASLNADRRETPLNQVSVVAEQRDGTRCRPSRPESESVESVAAMATSRDGSRFGSPWEGQRIALLQV
jgi:hypothetical protein